MKIPRKSELLSLQALYKTDERIGEALGGVPEYLVGYWRRKKKIGPYTEPKFTHQQIQDLWERFGDDFRCGRELNISRAAFYSWRRKYEILEKPAMLKLEQLQLRLNGDGGIDAPVPIPFKGARPRTSTAKILDRVREGWPDAAIGSDWTATAESDRYDSPIWMSVGPTRTRPQVPSITRPRLPEGESRQSFWCHPSRGDLAWQIIESRVVFSGELVASSGNRLAGLGGIGCLVLDETALKSTPRVIRVELTRRLSHLADVEDIALTVLSHEWVSATKHPVVEFVGLPIERLSVDRKVKLCALAVEFGAAAALCPFDDNIRRHYGRILQGRYPQTHPDRTAIYDEEHFLEVRGLEPSAGVRSEDGWSVRELRGNESGGIIVGPDALPYEIEQCAQVLKDRALAGAAPHGLIVCPATPDTYALAYKRGWAQTIVAAGGSIVDVAMSRRLGHAGLARLACGDTPDCIVYSTRPLHGYANLLLAGVQVALSRSGLIS